MACHLITSRTVEIGDRILTGQGTLNLKVVEIATIERHWTQFGTVVASCTTTDGEPFTLWGAGTIYHRASEVTARATHRATCRACGANVTGVPLDEPATVTGINGHRAIVAPTHACATHTGLVRTDSTPTPL